MSLWRVLGGELDEFICERCVNLHCVKSDVAMAELRINPAADGSRPVQLAITGELMGMCSGVSEQPLHLRMPTATTHTSHTPRRTNETPPDTSMWGRAVLLIVASAPPLGTYLSDRGGT